jgi:uncharacterized membrane protein
MKPLIVLLGSFLIVLACSRLLRKKADHRLAGRTAMSVMLLFTAIGHFIYTKGMALMLPAFIPFKVMVVYLSGLFEILAAIALFIPALRKATGWALIIFFVLILPANIHAAIRGLDYQTGTYEGPGMSYLWFRIPLQLLFIAWIYWFVLKSPKPS